MKKSIFVITLTLVALVIGGCAISWTTTPTPTASQTVNVSGNWSGTYSERSGGSYADYDVTIYFDPQHHYLDTDIVQGWMALNVVRSNMGYMTGQHIGVPGTVSGSTIILLFPEEVTCQVSGNSMSGSGTRTYPSGSTKGWSLNLTRVR